MASTNRPYLAPFVELGHALWIIENWLDFDSTASGRPSTMTLRRLDKGEVQTLREHRNDHECYAVLTARAKRKGGKQR